MGALPFMSIDETQTTFRKSGPKHTPDVLSTSTPAATHGTPTCLPCESTHVAESNTVARAAGALSCARPSRHSIKGSVARTISATAFDSAAAAELLAVTDTFVLSGTAVDAQAVEIDACGVREAASRR